MEKNFCSAIIPAAGKGIRMGTEIQKQFLQLADKEVIIHTLEKFENCEVIDEIIVVTGEEMIPYMESLIQTYQLKKVVKIIKGGKERQDSVYQGLKNVNEKSDIIVIHDGVRPFILESDMIKTIEGAKESGACILGVPSKDTMKVCSKNQEVVHTPSRDTLWAVQTPQTFRKDILLRGFNKAYRDDFVGTDESTLVERLGIRVKVATGSYDNIKITTKEDLFLAEALLKRKQEGLL